MKKNKHAVALGKLGGQKGGFARAAKLSPERRREIALKAINTRWAMVRAKQAYQNNQLKIENLKKSAK